MASQYRWKLTAAAVWSLAFLASPSTVSAEATADAEAEPRVASGRPLRRHVGEVEAHAHNHNHALGGSDAQLDADDPDFAGVLDFSNAIPGPGGSWCITKTKFVEHMVKDQIKECWHQNVTHCHDTYVTEFLPSQEQKCEETFWKSCKIDFRDLPYNYTMKQCHTPLQKECSTAPTYDEPKIVCKTWFESECNTTYTETTPNVEDKPNTWCKKVPRKICAPDNCRMVAGPEECHDKVLVSTVQKPTEICDLQVSFVFAFYNHPTILTILFSASTTLQIGDAIDAAPDLQAGVQGNAQRGVSPGLVRPEDGPQAHHPQVVHEKGRSATEAATSSVQ